MTEIEALELEIKAMEYGMQHPMDLFSVDEYKKAVGFDGRKGMPHNCVLCNVYLEYKCNGCPLYHLGKKLCVKMEVTIVRSDDENYRKEQAQFVLDRVRNKLATVKGESNDTR